MTDDAGRDGERVHLCGRDIKGAAEIQLGREVGVMYRLLRPTGSGRRDILHHSDKILPPFGATLPFTTIFSLNEKSNIAANFKHSLEKYTAFIDSGGYNFDSVVFPVYPARLKNFRVKTFFVFAKAGPPLLSKRNKPANNEETPLDYAARLNPNRD